MPKIALTFAACRYDRLEAIREGSVAVEGVDLTCLTLKSGRDVFDRMVGGSEFDVSELSASEFISLQGQGDRRFVALPVFPSRVFRHGFIFINTRSGIHAPQDLEGKRIGVPLYTQTAAIWARGLLADCGVDLEAVRWVQGAVENAGTHGKPHAPPLLKSVSIAQNDNSASLAQMLADGRIDALIGSRKPEMLGRHPDVARLFPNYRALERDLYLTRKIFPIMHLIAIRRAVWEQHPWLAVSLYKAFVESKRRAIARMRYGGSLATMLPWLLSEIEEIDEIFDGDAFPYGVERNRPTLDALIRYMLEQHFIPPSITINDLFVKIPKTYGA